MFRFDLAIACVVIEKRLKNFDRSYAAILFMILLFLRRVFIAYFCE